MKKEISLQKKNLISILASSLLSILVWIPTSFFGLDNRIYMMIASWIFMPCLIYCSRKASRVWEYAIAFCSIWFSLTLVHYGLYGTGFLELLPNLICTLIIFPAFLSDSLLHHKYNNFLLTLVFPFLYTSLSIVLSFLHIGVCFRIDMFSSILIIAYQIVSLIGSYGLTFVIQWIICSIFYIAENRKNIQKLKVTLVCPSIITAILVFGFIRFYTAPQADLTFKIAYAVGPYRGDFIHSVDVSYDDNVSYFKTSCKSAADQGATLVAYTEEAFYFVKEDADNFVTIAKNEAINNNISILLCIETLDNEEISQNKIIWIDSMGEIKANYLKSHLIPVLESDYQFGDNVIPYVDFDVDGRNVRISMCICYDSDDPLYTYTLNRDTDVFIVPSWDWELIRQKHTNSTAYVSLQNHVTFVKIAYDGWSSVIDPYGRKYYHEKVDTHDTNVHLMDVPVY